MHHSILHYSVLFFVKTHNHLEGIGDWHVQEAQTPLGHLPKSPSNDKLRSLLQAQLDKQQSNKGHSMIAALEAALQPIVGLEHLKLQLRRWAKGTLLNEKRRALGLHVPKRQPPHMCFLGNPGTGVVSRLFVV